MEITIKIDFRCNGKINSSGFCESCYQLSQGTSAYCTRLIDIQLVEQEKDDSGMFMITDEGISPIEQDPESDIPKFPTSDRDFTMTDKIEQEPNIDIAEMSFNEHFEKQVPAFDNNCKADDDFVKAHEQPANDQRESVGDILLKDDIETISAILSQEGRYEMANDLLRRYNNLITKYASQKQSVVLPSDEDIEKQSEIEIDSGIIDNFQTGHTPTAIKRRIWSYGAKWLKSQIKLK